MNTLLSVYGAGVASLVVIFILSFFFVHLARLVRIGWHAQKRTSSSNASPTNQPHGKDKQTDKTTETKSPSAPEPVYYIVERKRRVKSGYSEPKQIRFK